MRAFLILVLCSALMLPSEALCVRVFRDSEVENVIKKINMPLFAAANVDASSVKVFVVDDSSVNAYVSSGGDIFIHKGLMLFSKDPSVVTGVIAHEIAHMSQHHIVKKGSEIRGGVVVEGIGYILGMITSLAADPRVGEAIMLGSSTIHHRGLLAYSRAQEEVADQYALEYLDAAGYTSDGLLEVLRHFSQKESRLVDIERDEYLSTHPVSRQRIAKVGSYLRCNTVKGFSDEDLAGFKRIVEKTEAFLTPVKLLERSALSPYMQSILDYRKANTSDAIKMLGDLIEASPSDPYLYEVRAHIFYKLGQIERSIADYKTALKLLPGDVLIKLELAQALMLSDPHEAIEYLEQASYQEKENPLVWKNLAIVYGRTGNIGMSYFAMANRFFVEGDGKKFAKYAALSKMHLKDGSVQLRIIKDMERARVR
ncbi:M48 family metalloprotease [Anaplasma capra]|uniref:M48 family metalloprotease n=1 Tax=Anaplasma capra TaxID=1562740 RepID=UPI0021D5BE86|nr:M48 family metalloprotease [Anaplasma capra]MCU7611818.1 M48 family metalloprotease [Anaplasma capra]MCU7612588.1 M48 family metalloprotease [Anaplasma capra]